MATTVTLDSDLLSEVMAETREATKASAVRGALEEFLQARRLRELANMLGTIEMQFANEQIEAMEDVELAHRDHHYPIIAGVLPVRLRDLS